jgi:hypothetical protein
MLVRTSCSTAEEKSVGFIGGGRVARIILARLYCKLAE